MARERIIHILYRVHSDGSKEILEAYQTSDEAKREKDYQEQIKKIYEKDLKMSSKNEKVEVDGILISKKLLNKEPTRRICPVCSEYSFSVADDVYMKKFDCCFKCYVKWVEDREERWETGWRPDQNQEKT